MNTGIPNLSDRSSGGVSLSKADSTPATKTNESSSRQSTAPASTLLSGNSTPSSIQATQTEAKEKPSLQEVIQLSEKLNESIQSIQRDLNFSVDESLGEIVVTVIDRQTQETIRQIPSEEMLNLSRNIEEVNSLLFDTIKV